MWLFRQNQTWRKEKLGCKRWWCRQGADRNPPPPQKRTGPGSKSAASHCCFPSHPFSWLKDSCFLFVLPAPFVITDPVFPINHWEDIRLLTADRCSLRHSLCGEPVPVSHQEHWLLRTARTKTFLWGNMRVYTKLWHLLLTLAHVPSGSLPTETCLYQYMLDQWEWDQRANRQRDSNRQDDPTYHTTLCCKRKIHLDPFIIFNPTGQGWMGKSFWTNILSVNVRRSLCWCLHYSQSVMELVGSCAYSSQYPVRQQKSHFGAGLFSLVVFPCNWWL